MIPVSSYQVLEFIEWLQRHNIRLKEDFSFDRFLQYAIEFLKTNKPSLIFDHIDIELLMQIFQVCPMISEQTLEEQMKHYIGCGACFEYIRAKSNFKTLPPLHPLLTDFVEYANRKELSFRLKKLNDLYFYRFKKENLLEERKKEFEYIFRKVIDRIGGHLFEEFIRFVQEKPRSLIADFERKRIEGVDRLFIEKDKEEYTEPLNIDREGLEQAANRLIASLNQLIRDGYYDEIIASDHKLCKFLSLQIDFPENLAQSLEFLSWLYKKYPEIDISGDIPSDKISNLVQQFCESMDYSNALSFGKVVQEWLRGEGNPSLLSRLRSYIWKNQKNRRRQNIKITPFKRYNKVQLHGIFLFLSSGDFPTFIDKHWVDLNALTNDFMDIYFSKEDIKNRVSGYDTLNEFRSLEVNLTDLPALVLWRDSLKKVTAIPLGKLPHDDILEVVKIVVQGIKDKLSIKDISNNTNEWIEDQLISLNRSVLEYKRTKITINAGENIMGDKYEVGQGIAGKNVHAHDINFNELWNKSSSEIDLAELSSQLTKLRAVLRNEADTIEHDSAIGQVAAAEIAAREGEGPKALEHLKNAGKWALSVAEKIGVPVAVAALKSSIG